MDHPLCTVPSNDAGNAGIRDSTPLPDDPAKPVAALGLHYGVHVLPGYKAGTEGDGQRCHIPAGAKVALGQNSVHYDLRLCPGNTGSFRVNEHRNSALRPDGLCLLQRFNTDSTQTLNSCFAFVHCFTQGHLTADGRGLCRFQHQHPQPGAPQPVDGSGGKVAAAAHDN